MTTRGAGTAQERAAATGEANRAHLAAGNPRAALYRAIDDLKHEARVVHDGDPARAALLEASLAGSLAAIAETYRDQIPRKPPGYRAGPPSAADLLAAYHTAYTGTAATPASR